MTLPPPQHQPSLVVGHAEHGRMVGGQVSLRQHGASCQLAQAGRSENIRVVVIVPRRYILRSRHRFYTQFPHGYRDLWQQSSEDQSTGVNRLAETVLLPDACPLSQVLAVIGHRWTVQVLWALDLADRPLRFRELQRSLEPITQKELTNRLRELEASGMVHRTVYAEVPPRVEYRMTELGQTIMPLLVALAEWVKQHRPNLKGGVAATGSKPPGA